MLITENLMYVVVPIRDIVEVWGMMYFANYLFFGERLSSKRLFGAVIVVAGLSVWADSLTIVPILPAIILVMEAVALKVVSGRKVADVLGNLMFGIIAISVPELIVTGISAVAGISERSYCYFAMVIGSILLLICIGIVSNITDHPAKLKEYAEGKREMVVILAVSAMIPLVILGKHFLWDSLMFWEGYQGTVTLIAVYFVIGLYLIKTFLEFTKSRSELENSGAYSDYLSGVIDELNKREHEYKNQLNAIIGMAESGEEGAYEEIIAFAEEIIKENAQRKAAGNVISDNSLVAAYFLKMSRVAAEQEINFDYRIERPFPKYSLSNGELLEVIANLLNNGFEAVKGMAPENRNVSLCIEARRIQVVNYVGANFSEETLAKAFGTGFSTKGRGRGYGMANVLAVTQKNDIGIEVYVKGDYLEITLKM